MSTNMFISEAIGGMSNEDIYRLHVKDITPALARLQLSEMAANKMKQVFAKGLSDEELVSEMNSISIFSLQAGKIIDKIADEDTLGSSTTIGEDLKTVVPTSEIDAGLNRAVEKAQSPFSVEG